MKRYLLKKIWKDGTVVEVQQFDDIMEANIKAVEAKCFSIYAVQLYDNALGKTIRGVWEL